MRLPRLVPTLVVLLAAPALEARTLVVSRPDAGRPADYTSVQDALDAARPGDTVVVDPGAYHERVRTRRAGTRRAPITLRGRGRRDDVVLTARGLVLSINHPWVVVENLVLDGEYGPARTVDIATRAHHATLRHVEVRRSGRDCIRVRAARAVTVTNSVIHHCLDPTGGRRDAHGIVAGAVRELTIRETAIHTFSGDGIQLDPDRARPGWDDVLIERCRIWIEPLPFAEHGFAAGVVPGENAVDTKTWPGGDRASLTIRDTTAWGFRNGPIPNMAAFNLKEQVDVELDGVTIHDSEIAFRVRGAGRRGPGARVTIKNAVVYDVDVGVRHEDDILRVEVWHATFGLDVTRPFVAAKSPEQRPDVRNSLFAGTGLPRPAGGGSNLAVPSQVFVAPAAGDYRLRAGSAPVDAGVTLPRVTRDRRGRPRSPGPPDIGAHEVAPWTEGADPPRSR